MKATARNTRQQLCVLTPRSFALMVITAALNVGCSSSSREQPSGALESAEAGLVKVLRDSRAVDPALFLDGALVSEVTTEECTLNGGTRTTCLRLNIAGAPMNDAQAGPYCPPSITSSAKEGGIWFDGSGTVHDVDGAFIVSLPELYDDDRWQMYDPATGKVYIIDGAEGCEVAGDPENSSGRDNFCLSCSLEALGGGIQQAILIPTEPVPHATPTPVRGSNPGVALNGVLFGPPAPVDLILSTITLGVFDDCGGHANPHEGYHYHAATDCVEIVEQVDEHAMLIGYAMDGYAISAHLDPAGKSASGLDECGGHQDDIRGYHYHAQAPGRNRIVTCLQGESVDQVRGGPGGPPPPPPK